MIVDQLSKFWVAKEMVLNNSIPLINGIFSLTYILNRGAAFGILQGKSWFFLTMATLIVIAMIYYHLKYSPPRWVEYAMGLIVGGTIGNVIDRWYYGAVRDFFSIGWFPVFNVADMAIVTGGALLILYLFLNDPGKEPQSLNR
jgi:signal peptidase II